MTNKVGIGVEAQFDTSGIEQSINALGAKIASLNKVQFTPFSNTTKADVAQMLKNFEQLRKIHGDLNKRMKATGQDGSSIFNLDFDKMYPDAASRARIMRKVFEYSTGASFGSAPPPPPPRQPPGGAAAGGASGGGGGGNWRQGAANIAQAGLRAAGPAGGVAAGAIGTGMSAGFGAGLMGLMGGMLALGVSKFVGAVMERVGQAEDQAVALDRLKRTLGDVNVSFAALKTVVHGGAENMKITYGEAEKLATQFVKLGNVSNDQYKTIADEMSVGVGMSRAFGMDPSQGMGALGMMRGLGVTTNTQESRRFALLIGETIGKSGAFAKADEVMDALTSYTTAQTRNNLGVANVAGYAGLFSGLVGSGIPGMDPTGAASLIGRVNAALMAGGAKGEASQFFSAQVGAGMGLDPIQTMMLREGGAFATNDSMFGGGSVYSRFMGNSGPGGSTTFLQSTLNRLRGAYGGNKSMLAMATANHLGIGINQAMGLLSVDSNQIGEMQKYGDLSKLSGSGIGNLSKALYGTDDDRLGLTQSLLGRADVSDADKAALRGSPGDRELLAKLTAQYDQERTQGSDIRDSKNALENLKTDIASKLIPFTQTMRDGILFLAGGGKKSRTEVLEDIERVESEGRRRGIGVERDNRLKIAAAEKAAVETGIRELVAQNRPKLLSGEMTQAEHEKQMKPLLDAREAAMRKDTEAREWSAQALKEEAELVKKNIEELRKLDTPANNPAPGAVAQPASFGVSPGSGGGRVFSDNGSRGDYDALFVRYGQKYGVDPKLLKAIAMKESGLRAGVVSKPNRNGTRDYGLMQHNGRYLADRGLDNGEWQNPERSVEEAAKLLRRNIEVAGSVRGGVRMYNGRGPAAEAYADSVMASVPNMQINSTPLPPQAGGGAAQQGGQQVSGEVAVRLDLTPDAQRLLRNHPAPIFTRVHSNWRPSMGY